MGSTEYPQTQTLTPAEEIRARAEERKQIKHITLPSGITVAVRKPDMMEMLRGGYMPADLIDSAVQTPKQPGQVQEQAKPDAKNMPKYLNMIDAMVKAMLVDPVVVDKDPDPSKGEVLLEDFEFNDKIAITSTFEKEVEKTDSFRQEEQTTPGDAGSSVPQVSRPQAE